MCILSRFSRVRLFATLWTVAHQAPLSVEFSRQEYWSGFHCRVFLTGALIPFPRAPPSGCNLQSKAPPPNTCIQCVVFLQGDFPGGSAVEKVSVSQSYLTLWEPTDCSLPDSSVRGILQAGILEWVAVLSPFSRVSS